MASNAAPQPFLHLIQDDVLMDGNRVIIRPIPAEASDELLNNRRGTRSGTLKLLRNPIPSTHPDIPEYLNVRDKVAAVLSPVTYMFTLLDAVWAETGERRSTIYITCEAPSRFTDALKALDTALRIEIMPGIRWT